MAGFHLIYLICFLSTGFAMECFFCQEQEENTEKCIKSVKQCQMNEDTCISYIRWGIINFYTPAGQRQHFISKNCASREFCEKQKREFDNRCSREWYNDWACVECCQGDRCNYYVTLGAGNVKKNLVTIILGSLFAVFVWLRYN